MIDYLTKLNIKPDESAEQPCSSIISSARSSIIWENNTMNDKPLTKQEMIKIIESKGNQRTNFFNNLTEKQIDQLNRFAFGDGFIDEDDECKGAVQTLNLIILFKNKIKKQYDKKIKKF